MTASGRLRWIVLLAVVLATPVGGAPQTVGADDIETVSAQQEIAPNIQTVPETDTTTTRISASEDGSAEWELTIRMALETESDVEEFEAFQAAFEQNRSQYVGEFRDRMTRVVENAETETRRQMTASNFTGETGIQQTPRRWGYVTYRFEWGGFAETSDGRIAVGDVFQGGYFLDDDDILVFEVPESYEPDTIDPEPDRQRGGEIQYNGPASFEDERPTIAFVSGDGVGDTDPTTAPTTGGDQAVFAVAGLLIVLVVAGLAYGRLYRETDEPPATTGPAVSESQEPAQETATAVGDELATDEDRVRSLLAAEGGRIRQADIADRLGWSDSKTSRVLSDMAAEGQIEKLRIGRENVIDLVDEE